MAFALAVGGGALGSSLGTSHRRLCALISLGAGTLLGVTIFAIVPESLARLPGWALLLALASGYVVFLLVSKYVYHICPACAASHFDEATTHRFSEIATAMMVALGIHCLADGVALAAGHEAHASLAPGGRVLDFSLVLAICVHKVPEGLALGALLLGAGFDRRRTVLLVAQGSLRSLAGPRRGPRGRRLLLPGDPRRLWGDLQAPQSPRARQLRGRLGRHRRPGAGAAVGVSEPVCSAYLLPRSGMCRRS